MSQNLQTGQLKFILKLSFTLIIYLLVHDYTMNPVKKQFIIHKKSP